MGLARILAKPFQPIRWKSWRPRGLCVLGCTCSYLEVALSRRDSLIITKCVHGAPRAWTWGHHRLCLVSHQQLSYSWTFDSLSDPQVEAALQPDQTHDISDLELQNLEINCALAVRRPRFWQREVSLPRRQEEKAKNRWRPRAKIQILLGRGTRQQSTAYTSLKTRNWMISCVR